MKFYKDKKNYNNFYKDKVACFKLTCIFLDCYDDVHFLKSGTYYNVKNAAYLSKNGCKEFYLGYKFYGYEYNFNKQSWRKFVKMQVFL